MFKPLSGITASLYWAHVDEQRLSDFFDLGYSAFQVECFRKDDLGGTT
jgi:hypothetical protein